MEAVLYAEVYGICMIIVGLLIYWTERSDTNSTEEMWLKHTLIWFFMNFTANFLFTLFNRIFIFDGVVLPLSYLLKTLYFVTLDIGLYQWCGYAETVNLGGKKADKKVFRLMFIPFAALIAVTLANLGTHWMFYIDADYAYRREIMFRIGMLLRFFITGIFSVRLIMGSRAIADNVHRSHLLLTAAFPLCMLASFIFSYTGEAIPVICVSITVLLLCLYTGTTRHQISMDKLTQVNNRQNLFGYMTYKMKNHDEPIHLLMIDLDYFKSINDTYGHLEGDAALVKVAGVLKRACGPFKKRPYIARYGGDEFIIVMEGNDQDVTDLCAGIRSLLREANETQDKYELCLSIGAAEWDGYCSQKELIARADEELYKIKKARTKTQLPPPIKMDKP